MADTATRRGRAIQIEQFTKDNSWGPELNDAAIGRLDDMWGSVPIVVDADVALTAQNFITDQARSFVLILTGAGGFTVTHPAVDKPYLIVNNCAADVTMRPQGGTGATIRAGARSLYFTDDTGIAGWIIDPTLDRIKKAAAPVDLNGQKITNLAVGTSPADAVNRQQLDTIAGSTAEAKQAAEQAQASLNAINAKITISTAAPSGGVDGDLWFRIA